MHAQIQQVIRSLMYRPGSVVVSLSAAEQSALGRLVGRLYYNSHVLNVLQQGRERTGYPNNGGMHTLTLSCSLLDAVEMLEMIKEECLERLCRTEEEREVANQLSYVSQSILAQHGKL